MSGSGRAIEFLAQWRRGYRQSHGSHHWGEKCDRCLADAYTEWEALNQAVRIAGLELTVPAGEETPPRVVVTLEQMTTIPVNPIDVIRAENEQWGLL